MFKRALLFCSDLLVIGGATLLAALVREDFRLSRDAMSTLLPYVLTSVLIGGLLLRVFSLQRRIWRLSAFGDYLRISFMSLLLVVLTVSVCFLGNRLQQIPRALPVLQLIFVLTGLIGVRVTARLLFVWSHAGVRPAVDPSDTETHARTVVLVGCNRLTALYIRSVEDLAANEVRIAGMVTVRADRLGPSFASYRVLGGLRDIARIVSELAGQGVGVTHLCVMMARAELDRDDMAALTAGGQQHGLEIDFFLERVAGVGVAPESAGASRGPELARANTGHGPARFVQIAV